MERTVLVAIILGSESDRAIFDESKMAEILGWFEVSYEGSYISAHRNLLELEAYCEDVVRRGAQLFIAAASMAAALPGTITAILAAKRIIRPVIGVPLPTPEFPDAHDATLSMLRMPPGMPVATCGIGKAGFRNAAVLASDIGAWKHRGAREARP